MAALAVLLIGVNTGCEPTAPGYLDAYYLVSVDGKGLPSPVDTEYFQSGPPQVAQLEKGSLMLVDSTHVALSLTSTLWVTGALRHGQSRFTSIVPGTYYTTGDSVSFYIDNAEFVGKFADARNEVTLRETTTFYVWRTVTFRKK
jgi:hypothetical protein